MKSLSDKLFLKTLVCRHYPEEAARLYGAGDSAVASELTHKRLKGEAKHLGIRCFNMMDRSDLQAAIHAKQKGDEELVAELENKARERFNQKHKEGFTMGAMKKTATKKTVNHSADGAKAMLKAKGTATPEQAIENAKSKMISEVRKPEVVLSKDKKARLKELKESSKTKHGKMNQIKLKEFFDSSNRLCSKCKKGLKIEQASIKDGNASIKCECGHVRHIRQR